MLRIITSGALVIGLAAAANAAPSPAPSSGAMSAHKMSGHKMTGHMKSMKGSKSGKPTMGTQNSGSSMPGGTASAMPNAGAPNGAPSHAP